MSAGAGGGRVGRHTAAASRGPSSPSPARAVAEVVQRTRPEVLVLDDLHHDPEALRVFVEDYLGVPQGGAEAIAYPYAFTDEVNAGVPSGVDLDGDGTVGGPADALGPGAFPGQHGMALLSQHPVVTEEVRTFGDLRWADMPGARLPDDPRTPEPGDLCSPEALEVLRLSSRGHWDVPVRVGERDVHLLVSSPTAPGPDGPQDRDGLRNADEIRFWADYVSPALSRYVHDDRGRRGGLPAGAVDRLLDAPRVNDHVVPESRGALERALVQGGPNLEHTGSATTDTADLPEPPGGLRLDDVLPRVGMRITASGVFWPLEDDPLSDLVGSRSSSDHRLVWVDATVPGAGRRGPRG